MAALRTFSAHRRVRMNIHRMPGRSPRATEAAVAERIVALRRQRLTGRHIVHEVGVSPATVSRVLRRAGLSRLKDLDV